MSCKNFEVPRIDCYGNVIKEKKVETKKKLYYGKKKKTNKSRNISG